MSVLTRIKNNQITDSTILANTKIVPGSIVGSLFNANLTMTSDVYIAGNLTVQGSSSYLAVASTNTYVNDPLIVLNNAFTGTNTYDIGLLFNRGDQATTAIIWDESEDEFRLILTTDDGTSYGGINNSGFANLRVGNLAVNAAASFGSISTTGDLEAANLTLSGTAAINGGDITTTASTFNLVNSTVTDLNIGGDATTITLGSTSGVANIRNATTNILGNATVGGTLGVTGNVTTGNLSATYLEGTLLTSSQPNITTVGNLTTLTVTGNIGSGNLSTGIVTLTNGAVIKDTTGNGVIFGELAGSPGSNATVAIGRAAAASSQKDYAVAVGSLAGNGQQNIGAVAVGYQAGQLDQGVGAVAIGRLAGGTTQGNTAIAIGQNAGEADQGINSIAIGANAGKTSQAANTIIISATGIETNGVSAQTDSFYVNPIRNATGNVGILQYNSTTKEVTYSTDLPTVDITGNASVGGTFSVNGGELNTTAGSFNLLNDNATTINFAGAATTLSIGATSGTTTVNNNLTIGNGGELLTVNGSMIVEGGVYGNVTTTQFGSVYGRAYGPNATSLMQVKGNDGATGIGMRAVTGSTNLIYSSNGIEFKTGATVRDLDTPSGGTVYVTISNTGIVTLGNDIVSSTTTQNVFNTVATTVNAFGAATALTLGATTGEATIRNATTNISGNLSVTGNIDVNGPATFLSVTDESLTATRVVYAGTSGDLTDNADFTYSDNTLTVKNVSIDGDTNTITGTSGNLNLVATTNVIDAGGSTVANIADPVSAQDAVSLNYLQTQINSGVTNIQSDDSDVSIHDDGITDGSITSNVDGVAVYTVTASSASYYSGFVTIDNANTNVAINGTAYIDDSLTVNAAVTTNGAITIDLVGGNGLVVSNSSVSISDELVVGGNVRILANTESVDSTTGALVVEGGLGVGGYAYFNGNVNIEGNLHVTGTQTTFSSNVLVISDPMIYIGEDNTGDVLDLGIVASFTDAYYQHTGLVRDASDSIWKLFANVVAEPTTVIDFTEATYSTLMLGDIIVLNDANIANVLSLTSNVVSTDPTSGALVISGTGGAGIGGNLYVAGDIGTDQTSINLLNTAATTINFAGAATNLTIGAGTGNTIIRTNTLELPNTDKIISNQAVVQLLNENTSTINFGSQATEINFGNVGGFANLRNATTNILGNATVGGTFEVTGDTTLTGDLRVNGGDFRSNSSSFNLLDTDPVATIYAFGSASTINIGDTSGTLTINNPTVVGSMSTQDLYNTAATTLNFAGEATILNIGASSGNTSINNTLTVANTVVISSTGINLANTAITNLQGPTVGSDAANKTYVDDSLNSFTGTANITLVGTLSDLTVGNLDATTIDVTGTSNFGNLTADRINNTTIGDVTPAAATFTSVTDQSLTATRVTFAGTGGDLTDSADLTFAANILTVKNLSINGDTAEISVIGGSGNVVLNPDSGGVIDGTGSLVSNIADPVSAQDAVTLNYLQTTISSGITAISNDDTDVTVTDTGTGTITANVDGASTFEFATSSASFFSDLVTFDAVTSNVSVTGELFVTSDTTINGVTTVANATASTDYNTGALLVDGGLGLDGNLNISSGHTLTIGLDLKSNIGETATPLEVVTNANNPTPILIQNRSTGANAVSSFIALADNGGFGEGLATFGITSSNFVSDSGPSGIIKPNDTFLIALGELGTSVGGNLHVLVADGRTINYVVGEGVEANIVARIGDTNVSVLTSTASTSTTSGALQVTGGAGIGGAVWVGNGAVINDSQTSENFTVKGSTATSLIYAESITDSVVIGGSNATPQLGATLKVNSSDSLLIPVGPTAARPSNSGNVDVAGMLRFNSTTSSLEFYTGTQWINAGGDASFTIITNEQFDGDGANVVYSLTNATTTNGTVVAINGIVQIPTLAYSISGTTLTFTEAPAVGDIIDVRVFAVTQAVGDVSSGNGLNSLTPDDVIGTAIYSGTELANKVVRVTAEPNGAWAYKNGTKTTYDQTPTTVSSASTATLIDSFAAASYTSAKYVVQITQGSGNVQMMEALVIHNGSGNAYVSTYGVIDTNGSMGTLSANVVSSNVSLYYTSTSLTDSNVKVYTTYIV